MVAAIGMAMAISLVGPIPVTEVQAASNSSTVFFDDFSGGGLDQNFWSYRMSDQQVGSRLCSLPQVSNSTLTGGRFKAAVSKGSGSYASKVISRAKAAQASLAKAKRYSKKATKKFVNGCPLGTYKNSMVSTVDKVTAKYGTLSASIKFAADQGVHGSIWLQSSTPGSSVEIDMIESYGYGKGLASVIHVPKAGGTQQFPTTAKAAYLGGKTKTATKNKAWWSKFHTYSVNWAPTAAGQTKYTFSVDGVVTRTLTKVAPVTDYFIVMSNLSSDWELKYLKKPYSKGFKGVKKAKLPASMLVDWVKLEKTA